MTVMPQDNAPAPDQAQLELIERWWRAANYLSVGQIYLRGNPLLTRPLAPEHVKTRLLGHWGTTPGLNFVWAHVNRVIKQRERPTLFITGPGHGGPANVANAYLEGTYSQVYTGITEDEDGMRRLFEQFSYPGGIPSHAAPETPGSIHEGGELGYALSHAYGTVFDNPELVTVAVVGDGESETGPLAGSWTANQFVNPAVDGAVLPVLHLNGYKIANPTVLGRMSDEQLTHLFAGYGYTPHFVEVTDPEDHAAAHRVFAATLDECYDEIDAIQARYRSGEVAAPREFAIHAVPEGDPVPAWPMVVLRSPKGWTGPKEVDGLPVEGTWRAHQVPLAEVHSNAEHRVALERWMRSYEPEELFDEHGILVEEIATAAPEGDLRMSATPYANGGRLLKDLKLPPWKDYCVDVPRPGMDRVSPMINLGPWLREVVRLNPDNFRVFGPDETASNRLSALFDVTDKVWLGNRKDVDEHLARAGRVVEVLSEHLCEGWLEGYLLTGRHGLFTTYEAFIHVITSMFNQHAKWLKVSRTLPWRMPIASLNYILSSHVWQQDHNGFSHQDPGFLDHMLNKKPEVVRAYLPVDANTLLSTMDHVLRSRDYVNAVVVGKAPTIAWLSADEADKHCARGVGIWDFAGSERQGEEPDVVLGCAGDVATREAVAAAALLKESLPQLRIRVVNVVDLMRLTSPENHPHGLSDRGFDALFTRDRPVIFAYHGYPVLIHRLTYSRTNHANFHVHGYQEEGTTTTPFDMCMLNGLDRYSLAIDVLDRTELGTRRVDLRQRFTDMRKDAKDYTRVFGDDPDYIKTWTITGDIASGSAPVDTNAD